MSQVGVDMQPNSIQWSVAAAVALSLGLCSGTATAQAADDEADLTEVVVTGSRIRGIEPTGSPVLVVDREAIVLAGTTTTTDLLRKVPQIVGLGASETASAAQNGAANVTRASGVNLRGIGSNATLLLFDGRRLPPSGTQGQLTDASVVPAIALQRVEVVADGGSSIYGSDAVTGVVNLIPRSTFTGNESVVRFGVADSYDELQVAHIFGTSWGSGNLVIAGEYGDHSGLDGADRDFYTTDLRARGGSDLRPTTCSPGNIVVGGVSYIIPEGSTGVGLTPQTVLPGTRRCDNLPRGHIMPEVTRGNVFLSGNQDITEQFSLYLQGLYSRREFELRDSGAVSNLSVPRTNPFYFNPTGGTGNVTVQYDFANDFGLAVNPGTAESYQGTLGGRYRFGKDWQLDAYVSYGASDDEVRRTNNLNTTSTGINARLANPDPQQAFNPFGSGSSNSAAVNDALSNGQFIIQGGTELTVYAVQADGPVFDLPGGSVRLAVGAEYRDEELNSLLQSGSTVAPVVVPGYSSRSVKAVFGEVFVPLVGADNAVAGAQRLDLSISARFEEYSDFGNTSNPKVGLVWGPIPSLLVRGSWGTSFRAPGLAENDPRSGGYGLYGDNLPCPIAIPPATTCFGIGIAGGNPDLDPEDATTWSLGLEFTPESIAGLRAGITYYDIDYQNQIIGLRGTAGLLDQSAVRRVRHTESDAHRSVGAGQPGSVQGRAASAGRGTSPDQFNRHGQRAVHPGRSAAEPQQRQDKWHRCRRDLYLRHRGRNVQSWRPGLVPHGLHHAAGSGRRQDGRGQHPEFSAGTAGPGGAELETQCTERRTVHELRRQLRAGEHGAHTQPGHLVVYHVRPVDRLRHRRGVVAGSVLRLERRAQRPERVRQAAAVRQHRRWI